jgi:hypothetical protein
LWKEASSVPFETSKIIITSRYDLFPVELLDQQFIRIERNYGRLEAEVPPGLYLARCEIGGPAVERLVKVAAGQTVKVEFSETNIYVMPSAAPVPGTVSRREHYTEAVWNLARRSAPVTVGLGAQLVLFATRQDFAKNPDWNTGALPVNWRGVQLLDSDGRLRLDLPGENGRDYEDRRVGRAGFSTELEPGGYFLKWPTIEFGDGRNALQPLWLSAGWITFVFAWASGDSPTPQRDSVSIHMARIGRLGHAYDDETDRINGAAELALASLRTGRRQLGDKDLRTLLYAKFENPMLGLLGAHMLLQRSAPNTALFTEVCGNLRHLLGAHPDVDALEYLAAQRLGLPPRADLESKFDFPPMLRDGLLGIDDARWRSASEPRLTTTARLARLRLLPEGPWTMFWHIAPATTADALSHDVAPFVVAEAEATEDAQQLLLVYLQEFRERRGAHVLQLLDPFQLRWAGLSPEEARAAIASATGKKKAFVFSPDTLAKAAQIAEQIESLEKQLHLLLQGGDARADKLSTPKAAPKRRIALPQKARSAPHKTAEEGKGTLRPAVIALLKKSKNPLKTADIYDALVAQGYKFTFKEAKKVLGIRLYKMLGVEPLGGGVFQAKRDSRP